MNLLEKLNLAFFFFNNLFIKTFHSSNLSQIKWYPRSIFNETLMNIFSNFIPNKYITFDDRDPPWMNDFVKSKIKFKNQLYNTYIKNSYKDNDYNMLHEAINEVSKIISKRKEEYHYHLASKLNNPSTSAKTYWSILKTFYNSKKVSLINLLQICNTLRF